jgi:peroxiredoxin
VFFKVTCGTTKLATPAIERLARAYPGHVVGVGQDPPAALDGFARDYGLTLPLVPDLEPYAASDAYGIVSAPTAVVVDAEGLIADVAESWDRPAWNRLSGVLAALVGRPAVEVSEPGDGLPDFKPG